MARSDLNSPSGNGCNEQLRGQWQFSVYGLRTTNRVTYLDRPKGSLNLDIRCQGAGLSASIRYRLFLNQCGNYLLFSLAKSKLRSIFPRFLTARAISRVGLNFSLSPLLGHLFVVIARALYIGSVKILSK